MVLEDLREAVRVSSGRELSRKSLIVRQEVSKC